MAELTYHPVRAAQATALVCHLLDPDYRPMCGHNRPVADVHYTDPSGPLCDGCGRSLCEACLAISAKEAA